MHPHHLFFSLITYLIRKIYSNKKWSIKVFKVTNWTKYIPLTQRDIAINKGLRRGKQMDKLYSLLTRNSEFIIPTKLLPIPTISNDTGLVICTIHLPLAKVGLRTLLENNFDIDYALVGGATKDGKMAVWGTRNKLNTLVRNNIVLLKAKKILEQKRRIILMCDNSKTGEISTNIFKIVKKSNAKIIYLFYRLETNNTLTTWLSFPSHPYCLCDEEITINVNELNQEREKIIEHYKTKL
jgi:hypothetical protein